MAGSTSTSTSRSASTDSHPRERGIGFERDSSHKGKGGGGRGTPVAVKLQYPDALPTMLSDLRQIRRMAFLLSKFEIKFDLLSAVDELAKQIVAEFDFQKEAATMDNVAQTLRGGGRRYVYVPYISIYSIYRPSTYTSWRRYL